MNQTGTLLRYFDCRGRGQPLRYALSELSPGFEDARVPLDGFPGTWMEMKKDRSKAGPFGALPLLVQDGVEVAPIGQLGMSCCTEDSPLGVTRVEKGL